MSNPFPIKHYETLHNNKYPNDLIEVLYRKNNYIYFETSLGICKKIKSTFGHKSYSILSAIDKTQFMINKFKTIHGNKYIYDKVIFIKELFKVIIICPKHGEFLQTPNKHLQGRGCEKCARERTNKHQRENATGWSLKSWKNLATKSKKFDSFKVYILECWNAEEKFYKIGRTFKTIKNRFDCVKSMPYNYKIIHLFIDEVENIYILETKLKRINKEFKYIPKIKFNGMQECYFNFKIDKNEKSIC
jgi:hypothetical protein